MRIELYRAKLTYFLQIILSLLPERSVRYCRSFFCRSTGFRRNALTPIARILSHYPLAPMEEVLISENPPIRLTAGRSRLVQRLYWFGADQYEAGETDIWKGLCAQANSILELGANIGYYTVLGALAAPDSTYTAVEANPVTADALEMNILANHLANVTVVRAAVVGSDEPPVMDLMLPDLEPSVPTGAYLSAGTEGIKNRPALRTISVPTVPMAELIGESDLIKLDIEGYEATVLESVCGHLLEFRPTIVVEVLKDVPRLREIIRKLHDSHYCVLAIGGDQLHQLSAAQIESADPLPRFGSRDVVLMPEERFDKMSAD